MSSLALAGLMLVACNSGEKVAAGGTTPSSAPKTEWNANKPVDANNEAPASNSAATNAPVGDPTAKNTTMKPAAEPVVKDVDPSGQKNWTVKPAATDSATKLASEVDANLKALRDSKLHSELSANFASGEQGTYKTDFVIADNQRYVLTYAKLYKKAPRRFETYTVRRLPSGKYGTLVEDKYVEGRVAPDKDVLGGWVTDSTHYLATAYGLGGTPVSDLVKAAQKSKWKVSVESKTFANQTFDRILMVSPDGKKSYELMIEPKMKLPVNLSIDIDEGKRRKTQITQSFVTLKSDHKLTEADLKPGQPVKPIDVISPEEARKRGYVVPDTFDKPGTGDKKEPAKGGTKPGPGGLPIKA